MAEFFISYTHKNKSWAEWIGYALQLEGFEIVIQAWDFRPSSNFVLEMQQAVIASNRTILVLSPDYMKSAFTAPEWAAAFVDDPQGFERKIVPILVEDCVIEGLLKPIVQIRLVGLSEDVARTTLINGIKKDRVVLREAPPFPGKLMPSPVMRTDG